MKFAGLLVSLALAASAQPPGLHIALRLDDGQILMIGEELKSVDQRKFGGLPKLAANAELQPGESIYLTAAAQPLWRPGDRWQLSAGIPIHIDRLGVTTYCGGIGGYQVAIARPERWVAGEAFVAWPWRTGSDHVVAQSRLEPVSLAQAESAQITAVLVREARGFVKSEDWNLDPNASPEFAARIRRANRAVMSGSLPAPQLRVQLWGTLLFVEAVWLGSDNLPLFACDAVFQERVLQAFTARRAEYMRMEEFADRDWRLTGRSAFLGAWQIGGRRYVLQYSEGLEAYSVELMELVPGKGLGPAGVSFSAGC